MAIEHVAPLVNNGVISNTLNLWLAIPTGFVFGFGLYHGGFTDSRRIAAVFYLKDVAVPVEMFAAIITGMLGIWVLGLIGLLNLSQIYFLPTFLLPMAVAGLIFGVGMALGGFCPGTAAAAAAVGRIDGMVFVLGVFGGSLFFGDLFPFWSNFYHSDYRGVFRLDQLFGSSIGVALLIIVVAAVAAAVLMRYAQRLIWKTPKEERLTPVQLMKYEVPWVGLALVVAVVVAFFPSGDFLQGPGEAPYYILQKSASVPATPHGLTTPKAGAPAIPPPAPPSSNEGC